MANLLTVAGAAAVIATVAAKVVFSSEPRPAYAGESRPSGVVMSADPTPVPTPSLSSGAVAEQRWDYALDMRELRGLPLDAPPGTPLELWVAWDQAVAEGPQMQKLVKSVTLSRFIEPVTAQGPMVVVLSVPERAMRAVMYGDLYGSFSVALPTG